MRLLHQLSSFKSNAILILFTGLFFTVSNHIPSIIFAQSIQIPTITSSDISVNENDGSAVFTFKITPPADFTASYSTSDGSATDGSDYTGTKRGSISFKGTQDTATVSVPITDDSTQEPDETFTITVMQPNQQSTTWTATIKDNDAPAPTSPPATSAPTPTNTPIPTATPKPTLKPTVFIPVSNISPTEEPAESPTPTPEPSPTATPTPTDAPVKRSAMVAAITSPDEIPVSAELLFLSLLSTGFLVLLIVFPADLFNSTVQGNYEEISRWSLIHRAKMFYDRVNRLPALLVVIGFAIAGAVINSFLSPDFGFNQPTFALILGLLIALFIITFVYDITRKFYMKRRFGLSSKLRAHSLGLFTGSLLVAISRLSNFLPGYCYGLFTGLVYQKNPTEKEDGEGVAISALMLLAVALAAWFSWVPIKEIAMGDDPSFMVLVIDAAVATLWVSALTATVFGLMPLRFMYGEVVKKWSFPGWAIIYITGVYLFVYTLLNPAIGIYGKSDKVSWAAVLSLFFGFGIFSFLFWGYFRYRGAFGWKPKK